MLDFISELIISGTFLQNSLSYYDTQILEYSKKEYLLFL